MRELNAAAFAEGRIVVAEEANGNGWTEHCATAEERRMAAFDALSATVAALTAERDRWSALYDIAAADCATLTVRDNKATAYILTLEERCRALTAERGARDQADG